MTVQDLFRILPEYESVLFNTKRVTSEWYGLVKDIPNSYFDCLVESIYSMAHGYSNSYIVINIAQDFQFNTVDNEGGEPMTNNIKLGTLVKLSATTSFWLHDIQYDIDEFYTRSQILENKQLSHMKVVSFKALSGKEMIYVKVEEQKRGINYVI